MKFWMQRLPIFLVAGVVYGLGEWYWHSRSTTAMLNFGQPLIAAGQILAIVGIILLAANQRALHKWLWFSLVYIPLGALFVVASYPVSGAIFDFSSPPVHNTWLVGYLYILITLIIVLHGWWRGRRGA